MARKTDNPGKDANVKSIVKALDFLGVTSGCNTSVIDVKDGRIVRIKPLHYDWKYKPEEMNPWKIEARGQVFEPTMKSLIPPLSLVYKKRVYSPNRIFYPLKRVDFDPKGERNPQNRGISGYERISWDDALDIIAGEIRRVVDKYGPSAVLLQSDGHAESQTVHAGHGCSRNLMNLLGGYTQQQRNPDSWEGWYWGAKHVWGMDPVGQMNPCTNVWPDIMEHSEIVLIWGGDPETTSWAYTGQMSSRISYFCTDLGIKQIYICPEVNYGAAVHADKWIPVLPNTDAALRLAIAYMWITEGTYDKDYVATHTVGFDKFEEYVLGKEDGIPKTPKWAEGKCGVPSRIIKALAREWASKPTSISHGNGGGAIRGPYATEPARLEVFLLAMQGLGKPGVHWVRTEEWGFNNAHWQNPMPHSEIIPDVMAACQGQIAYILAKERGLIGADEPVMEILPPQIIPRTRIHDAILNPPLTWYGSGSPGEPRPDQFRQYKYPVDGHSLIHMIWTDAPCWVTCWNDGNRITEAYRHESIEFMMAQHPWLENDCLFADIILPSNTKMEAPLDVMADNGSGQFNLIMAEHQCIEPVGESVTDYEVVCKIADRLGLLEEYRKGRYRGKVRSPEEWAQFGFDTSGAAHMISWEELKEKGYFVLPTDPNWKKTPPGLRNFYEDPEKYPLTTPTGKLEFFSQALAEGFPDDEERPPSPQWIEGGPGWSHDETLSSERAKKYPLILMSNHPRWRMHAMHDDVTWLREIPTCKVKGPDGYLYEPIWMNPSTAREKGIEDGDIVKMFNERGAVLGGAYVTERIMPGIIYQDHGARYDPIVVGELDRGGANNTICPHSTTSKNAGGMATSGYLVEVERVDLDELRRKYPEAFNRPYHQTAGLCFERALHNNGE